MIVLYLILSLIFGLFFSLCYVHLIKYKDLRSLPGPSVFLPVLSLFCPKPTVQGKKSTCMVTRVTCVKSVEVFELLTSLNKTYGPVVKIWVNPFCPKLIVTDLKYIEILLSSSAHLEKTKFYRSLESFAGEGLATAPAAIWKNQKKIVNLAFRNKTLEKYVETFEKYGDELITELSKYEGGLSFDILPILTMCALKIICATLMQVKSCCAKKDVSEYSEAREGFFRILLVRSLSILTQSNLLFHYTRAHADRERHAKVLNDFSNKVIDAYRKQDDHAKLEEDKHFVDYILENYELGSKEMLDQVGTFILAGHETVAATLGFTLYELAKYPEVQRKIVEEGELVLGKKREVQVEFSDLQNLKYMDCVIKEILRKYPVVPIFERKTTEPMEIHGVRIPERVEVAISAYNVHLDEANYPHPEVFDPDRFLPENEGKIKPFAYLPFCLGPRNCIGKHFAVLETKSLLTKIIRHYEVLPAETQEEMKLFSEFSLKSTIGTPIRLIPRGKSV